MLLIGMLLVAGIVVFFGGSDRPEGPGGRVEDRSLDQAAPSSEIADRRKDAASPLRPMSISPQLIEVPKPELAGQFLRMWRVSGANVCAALREAGIAVSEWKPASMRNRNYECYFQRVYQRDETRPLSSTFLKVRGNEMGEIVEIRARIIGPTTDDEGRLAPAILRMFEIIVKQACWRDFEDSLTSIQNLRSVEYERFGAYLNFTREAGGGNNLDFVLGLKATSASQVRTKTYFSPERWLTGTDRRNVSGNVIRSGTSANCA
ncbi:exopolysaccharide biosynthesis protein [Rhizobium binae]|nr:exopolysaccharide biosynthesis protein [Rhizobium binae]NKL48717.1 exopolysaccharide biosynthesis protein [Rhizobium leguminosarum bv. viciae]MBX4936179.1 exopolysaccharide biosynthesis protein [Rhizobium binae]MBX4942678.1 exopolysaccharide biosynthesis protein [Rhizobium binae]MBX4960547.1 exopolysaccharide biosynthesis protein [Rhizobium binae]